tara:strand:- start:1094 stop:1267 length:174 start_codon:yes stop_codon:yes gene_type:complete
MGQHDRWIAAQKHRLEDARIEWDRTLKSLPAREQRYIINLVCATSTKARKAKEQGRK